MIKKTIFALAALTLAAAAHADTVSVLTEGFESGVPSNWIQNNANVASATPAFFQGYIEASSAQSGSADSYVMANYLTPGTASGYDVWLITPEVTLISGATLSFFTKTIEAGYNDTLQVYFNAGSGTAVSDFTNLLTTVSSSLTTDWQQISASLASTVSGAGRFAFRYTGNILESSSIAIDSVSVSTVGATTDVPEPASIALLGLGVAGLMVARRKQQRA